MITKTAAIVFGITRLGIPNRNANSREYKPSDRPAAICDYRNFPIHENDLQTNSRDLAKFKRETKRLYNLVERAFAER